jgi:hypothetical protein
MSTPHFALLDADDHRIWTDQWFNSRFDKARPPKPTHHLTFGERGASAGFPVAASTADLLRGAVWAHGVGLGSRMELAEKSSSSPRERGQLGDFIGLPTCTDHCGSSRMRPATRAAWRRRSSPVRPRRGQDARYQNGRDHQNGTQASFRLHPELSSSTMP